MDSQNYELLDSPKTLRGYGFNLGNKWSYTPQGKCWPKILRQVGKELGYENSKSPWPGMELKTNKGKLIFKGAGGVGIPQFAFYISELGEGISPTEIDKAFDRAIPKLRKSSPSLVSLVLGKIFLKDKTQ